jgi:hypothetical protein
MDISSDRKKTIGGQENKGKNQIIKITKHGSSLAWCDMVGCGSP